MAGVKYAFDRQAHGRLPCRQQVKAIAVGSTVAVVLILATWSIAATLDERAYERQTQAIRRTAVRDISIAATAVQARVQAFGLFAEVFSARANTTHPMPQQEFDAVVRRFNARWGENAQLAGVFVQTPVDGGLKGWFEQQLGRPIMPGEPSSTGDFLPVVLVWPARWGGRAIGMERSRRFPENLMYTDKAIRESKVVASPFTTGRRGRRGLSLYAPIIRPGRASGVVEAFALRRFFTAPFESLDSTTSLVHLHDVTAGSDVPILHPPQRGPTEHLFEQYFHVATRVWHVSVFAPRDVLVELADAESESEIVWASGVSVGVILGVVVFALVRAWQERQRSRFNIAATSVAAQTHRRMLNYINHELRNPMTVIMAVLEQYVDPKAAPSRANQSNDLGAAFKAATQVQDMLNSVLDVTDAQTGNLTLRAVPTDVVALLRDATNQLASFCRATVSISVAVSDNVPAEALVDGGRLRQVLTAALQAAVNASRAGVVEVRARCLSASGTPSEPARDDAAPGEPCFLGLEVLSPSRRVYDACDQQQLRDARIDDEGVTPAPPVVVQAALQPFHAVSAATCRAHTPSPPLPDTDGEATAVDVRPASMRFERSVTALTVADDDDAVNVTSVATTLSPQLCRTFALAMGGDAGVQLLPRDSQPVSRFWCVVAIIPQRPAEGQSVAPSVPSGRASRAGSFESSRRFGGEVKGVPVPPLSRLAQPSPTSMDGSKRYSISGAGGGGAGAGSVGGDDGCSKSHEAPVVLSFDAHASSMTLGGHGASASLRSVVTAPKPTAVVVDDEKIIRRLVSRFLKRQGVRVVASLEDGDLLGHCLENLPAPPSFILLDIVMRRSSGVDTLVALRKNQRWAGIPVYAMTSNVERVQEYQTCGFSGLLGKPFSQGKLAEVVQHATSRSGTFLSL